jgi:ArsR family transcriptional regulator, cadmium/lead-responsive transcriptional repressor
MEAISLSPLLIATTNTGLLARLFAAVSEPIRLQLLLLLLEREYNVGELVQLTGASQGRVSIHMQCLRHCGFVTSERRGKYVYYSVRDDRVRNLVQQAQALVADYSADLASCGVLNDEAHESHSDE